MKQFYKPLGMMLLLVLTAFQLNSCRDSVEVFSIQRVGTFSFSTDNLNTQFGSEVRFFQGKIILHQYSPGVTEVLTRYLLRVTGRNAAGRRIVINIEFDLFSTTSFIGIYRPQYVQGVGGLSSFNYVEEISPNTFKSYNLDPSFLDEAFFRVKRQSTEEKLILGDFFARLQNDQNPDEKLVLYEGIYKDISYAL